MGKSNNAGAGASSKKAVVAYSVALFVVVVVFISISYLINERGQDKVEAMHEQQTTALQRIDMLRSENERLQAELLECGERIAELEESLKQTHLDWAEDTKRIEDKHITAFGDLLNEYNGLLARLEALEAEKEAETE